MVQGEMWWSDVYRMVPGAWCITNWSICLSQMWIDVARTINCGTNQSWVPSTWLSKQDALSNVQIFASKEN